MADTATKPKPSPFAGKIKAVHACRRKVQGLDDDAAWRGFLETVTGKRSLRAMSGKELGGVIDELHRRGAPKRPPKRAGTRPMAGGREARKIRALWLSLYHLGCVQDPSERALNGFVRRQCGVDDMRFMRGDAPFKVIEALKDWAGRTGDKGGGQVDWSSYVGPGGVRFENPRARVLEAQWRQLHRLGVVRIGDSTALSSWIERFTESPCRISYINVPAEAADRAIEALGARIRKSLAERGEAP